MLKLKRSQLGKVGLKGVQYTTHSMYIILQKY